MPPRSLAQVAPARKPTFTADALFVYPDLGKIVMTTVGFGAACDGLWNDILVDLLGHHSSVALAMYNAVISTAGQRATVLAVAQEKLGRTDNLLFGAVYNATQKARDTRNQFAHHLWGLAYGLNNALVTMNPQDATKDRVRANRAMRKVRGQMKRGQPQMPLEAFVREIDPDNSKVLVWQEQELLEAMHLVRDAYFTIKDLRSLLSGSAKPDLMRIALRNRPLVELALRKILQNNTPKELRTRLARTLRLSMSP